MSFLVWLVSAEWVVTLLVMMDLGPFLKLVSLARVGTVAIIVKILAGATVLNLASTINGIYKILRRTSKMASPTSADHFVLRTYLLDSFLMVSSLLLLLVISRLHDQVNQIDRLKLNVETLKKQSQAVESEYMRLKAEKSAPIEREHAKAQEEIVSLKDLVAALRTKMENLQLESLEKDKVVKAAEANARALQKQSEGFLLEYDRLLDDNESLRSQLASFDRKLSHSASKKYA
ncbi:hypothetical protein GOP47_0014138 [Adiantum capillus-veneris]|uniref:Endoplasmic reticulum transmembrane protein n=1 Tax=Adiantum capillus-veneris TaxID=13818 RepID=A0A9D4ZF85_ADICA|nr:hypothetical protein GOP47_0014138 [Adiantum capillus-veneris]